MRGRLTTFLLIIILACLGIEDFPPKFTRWSEIRKGFTTPRNPGGVGDHIKFNITGKSPRQFSLTFFCFSRMKDSALLRFSLRLPN